MENCWNILPTKAHLSSIIPSNSLQVCPLCKAAEDSLQHLFFNCSFARIIWRNSFWPLDSTTLNFSNMVDWINIIITHGPLLGIPSEDHHKFQIIAAVSCDLLWFHRNKAYHDGTSFDFLQISRRCSFTPLQIQHHVGPGQSRRNQSPPALEFWQPFIELWVTSFRNEHI